MPWCNKERIVKIMKKKEVTELMKKFYIFGGVPFAAGAVLALIMVFVNTLLMPVFLMIGMIPALITFFTFYVKAKKMEANACIKCPSQNKTKVSEDLRLSDETIDGALCEVHKVTHTCEDCGTEYTCIEYKRIKA